MRQHAFIFPGQGSQYVGMGKDLVDYSIAMQTYEEADDALGFSLKDICWNGPEDKLKETAITQPAILTASIAVYRILLEKGFTPAFVAGHSLGEYSALVAAGVLDLSDAVRIVRKRGELMQTAVPLGVGKMSAILGLERDKVEEACRAASSIGIVEPANYNCPGQVVIGGEAAAVEVAAVLCKETGAKKTIELSVSAPFHTSLMRKAGEGLEDFIKDIEFKKPEISFISNVDAKVIDDPITIKASLVKQVSSKIFWEDCINVIVKMGCDSFVEVGPGKVLSGFVKKIAKDVHICNAGDAESIAKINECLGGMKMLLKDKRVLITGANRGIGAEIVKMFVAQGAHIALNHPDDENNRQLAETLIGQLAGSGSKVVSVPGDVSQAKDVAIMFESAARELGGIDILINNAGITKDGLIMRMKDEDWDSVIAVNLKGVFNCCRQAAKYMLKTPGSKIINVSSVVGLHGNAGQVNYSASKAGIVGITKSLAKEFSSRGVCVNAIAPGFIQTDMTSVLPEKVREKMLEEVPLGRIGTAMDVANAALFLASGLSDYITGQIIVVDGGMTI